MKAVKCKRSFLCIKRMSALILCSIMLLLCLNVFAGCSKDVDAPDLMVQLSGGVFKTEGYIEYYGKTLTMEIIYEFGESTVKATFKKDYLMTSEGTFKGTNYDVGEHLRETDDAEYNYKTVSAEGLDYVLIYQGDDPYANKNINLIARLQVSRNNDGIIYKLIAEQKTKKDDMTYLGFFFDEPSGVISFVRQNNT